ncbi:MAG: abortive infection family protein [Solirubrobacteraceae bacterium]
MQSPILDAASEIKQLMVARVTGAPKVDSHAYKAARDSVVGDPAAAKLAPECVRICRSPDEVWTYVKGQFMLDTYQSRREFFQREFEPLLTALERFASAPLDDLVSAEAEALDSASVLAAWGKAVERRSGDPEGAITAARTLLESVCKTILDDLGESYGSGDDLPKLYRVVSKALKLAPADYTDEQLRRILGGATTVVEGLGSLRNSEGDAHGRGRKSYKPSGRHAGLAVNLAGSVAVFLMQTWEDRRE